MDAGWKKLEEALDGYVYLVCTDIPVSGRGQLKRSGRPYEDCQGLFLFTAESENVAVRHVTRLGTYIYSLCSRFSSN